MDFSLLLMSLLVGLLIGLTSMGGAALMTPFLVLIVGVRPVVAVGTDLAYGAITKMVGAGMHWRQGTVDFRMTWKLACGSVPGGLLGVLALVELRRAGLGSDQNMRRAIGSVLVLVALVLLARCFRAWPLEAPWLRLHHFDGWSAVLWGAIVGFAVGFTSVGSGSLILPFLMLAYPQSPARVVGTDVFHAAILVTVTASAHVGAGNVDWRLASLLLMGSVPGVLLGSYLAPRLPARWLRIGLALVLLASGVKMM